MMNRPGASVVRGRDPRCSREVAVTTAPPRGRLSGPVTVPVMMSVVAPTWPAAGRDARGASSSTSGSQRGYGRRVMRASRAGGIRSVRSWQRLAQDPGGDLLGVEVRDRADEIGRAHV